MSFGGLCIGAGNGMGELHADTHGQSPLYFRIDCSTKAAFVAVALGVAWETSALIMGDKA